MAIPVYQAKLAGQELNFTDQVEETGFSETFSKFMNRCKGSADTFGIIQRVGNFATPLVPESVAEWTSQVSSTFGKARTALALPYSISLACKLTKNFEVRNAADCASAGFFAASLLTLNQKAGACLAGVGSTFRTAVDALDLKSSIEKYGKAREQLSEAEGKPETPPQVVAGLRNILWVQALKTARFVFALFTGILTILKFIFNVMVAKELLIAGVISGILSLGFSYAAELVHESSEIRLLTKKEAEAWLPKR